MPSTLIWPAAVGARRIELHRAADVGRRGKLRGQHERRVAIAVQRDRSGSDLRARIVAQHHGNVGALRRKCSRSRRPSERCWCCRTPADRTRVARFQRHYGFLRARIEVEDREPVHCFRSEICAEPSKDGAARGSRRLHDQRSVGGQRLVHRRARCGPDDDCCGNASGSASGFPLSSNKLAAVSAGAELLLTSVNVVFHPPSASRCGMEPTKLWAVPPSVICTAWVAR